MEKAVRAIIKTRRRRAELAPHSSPAPSPERRRQAAQAAAAATAAATDTVDGGTSFVVGGDDDDDTVDGPADGTETDTTTAHTRTADAAAVEPLREIMSQQRPGTARARALSRRGGKFNTSSTRRATSATRRRATGAAAAAAAAEMNDFDTVAILRTLAAGRRRPAADVGLPFDVTPGHIVVVDEQLQVVNGVRSQPHSTCQV